MESIDLTTFSNAIKSLIEILNRYERESSDLAIRDAAIQRFEYTYSLALKMIKRFFKISAFEKENIDGMTFNEMVRTANRMGLLKSNLEQWTKYREIRNMTSHTYDEEIAQKVVALIPDFKEEAVFLLNKLEEKTE